MSEAGGHAGMASNRVIQSRQAPTRVFGFGFGVAALWLVRAEDRVYVFSRGGAVSPGSPPRASNETHVWICTVIPAVVTPPPRAYVRFKRYFFLKLAYTLAHQFWGTGHAS